jgi:hypothetical protein
VRINTKNRFHRFVSGCVVALLTANAFAIAMIVADDLGDKGAESTPVRTLTLVTTADGRRFLVDPNSEAGRQAIDEARRTGGTVTQVTVPSTSSTAVAAKNGGSGSTLPTLPKNGILEIDPGTIINDTLNTLLDTVTTVSSILDSTASTASSIVKETKTSLDELIDSTQSTLANVSTSVKETATTASSTLSSTVSSVVTTVSVLPTTVSTTVGGLVDPVGGSLGGLSTSEPICQLSLC